jgi:hypothetical protein
MSILMVLLAGLGLTPTVRALPCDGPDADPWAAEFRGRVESYHRLFQFAQATFGPPTSCDGMQTMEFDGASFGYLRLGFDGGVELLVETMPPESSISTLTDADGFEDAGLVRATLESYAAGIGLSIDWSTPEITSEAGGEVHTFWDPEPGLNASASLIYVGGVLMGVRLGMAL